jgi:multidrug efflux pump subunit AcrA (membrane-fusion protein)
VAAASLLFASCAEVESESATGYEPSKLEHARVEFTAEAAARAGLRTGFARRSAGRVTVPYAALLYGPEGKTYVYTSPRRRVYLRDEVRVDRIEGNRVRLSGGLRPGTRVVTVGAAEVYGTELEVAAE